MKNPFTPTLIASEPDDFFGRGQELRDLDRSLAQGSVAIQGPVGIGKSSLLARGRLMMEGFDSDHRCETILAVADRDVTTVDQAARLLLECFTDVDEHNSKIGFKVGSFFEIESADICRSFAEGRHLAALKRIVQRDHVDRLLAGKELLILAIDEADKCPVAVARLVRSIATHTQQNGIRNVRFLLAGVSPFLEIMAGEDAGVNRFVYRTITLAAMPREEAEELVEEKFRQLIQSTRRAGAKIELDPSVIRRMVDLSGGHPHILQLLGSHVVEHEADDPDGVIDARDFHDSLRRICFEDRGAVYTSTIHQLQVMDKFDSLLTLLGLTEQSPLNICSRTFPTKIDANLARENVPTGDLDWLVRNNILHNVGESYRLIDEFLRIRVTLEFEQNSLEANPELRTVSLDDLSPYEREIALLDPDVLNFPNIYADEE